MRTRNLYRPFEVELFEGDEYIAREHRNTYFEMVFILEGSGKQIINKHELPYSADKLFLIFPQDTHSFVIEETTRFFFLRFNESYLKQQPKEWLQKLEYIFYNHNHMPGCILKNVTDKPLIRSLAEALLREQQANGLHQQEVSQQLLNVIITIAARNISLTQTAEKYHPEQPLSLVGYVHQNIYSPENLKARKLAEHFNISAGYVSEYFKRETGESLQAYVQSYRQQLIEARLLQTNLRLNEIAAEFGLSDVSHLNKLFQKERGISPLAFRQMMKAKSLP